jgi:hypothetical protein
MVVRYRFAIWDNYFNFLGVQNMNISTKFLLISLVWTSLLCAKSATVPTDIFYAVKKGDVKAVKAWITTKPDLAIKNDQGQSLLTLAVASSRERIVNLLLKAGAQLNVPDKHGKTVLDYALEHNQPKIAKLLVRHAGVAMVESNKELLEKMLNKPHSKVVKVFGILTATAAGIVGISYLALFILTSIGI